VTMMQATPSTWKMLVEYGWQPHRNLSMLTGGESLPEELTGALLRNGVGLWNVYGPT